MGSNILLRTSVALLISVGGCVTGQARPLGDAGIAGDAAADDAASTSEDASASEDAGEDPAELVSFSRDIMPLLVRECTWCHVDFRGTADTVYVGLLDDRRIVNNLCLVNPNSLRLVEPGSPVQSGLWWRVGSDECETFGMPPGPRGMLREFDPEGAELIRRWIEEGALYN